MAGSAAGDERSSSLSVADGEADAGDSDAAGRVVRCVVHNFPLNEDVGSVASTIRSLLEPYATVLHCQLSTTGLSVCSINS